MKLEFLDLGRQPIANGFLYADETAKEYFFDLKMGFDTKTKLVSQMEYVDPPLMFNENYAYRGSMSKTMVEHFKDFSLDFLFNWKLDPSNQNKHLYQILEIGSNDGVFLKNWPKETTFAVEPCSNFAEETNKMGYKTYPEFWTVELAEKIKEEQGKMDLIFAANCICHIPDLEETFKAVSILLEDDGMFVFEDPSLAQMILRNSYDQMYDEHVHIFSVTALKNILSKHNLEIVRVDNISTHGGSNRIWVKHTNFYQCIDDSVQKNLKFEELMGLDEHYVFNRFAEKVKTSKEDLLEFLINCKRLGKKVVSYGATSKSTTIFNYCGITKDLISYVIDTTPEKIGKLTPGTHIPIYSPDKFDETVDVAFLGAWNFKDEILKKESDFVDRGGKFITHVPVVTFI